VAATEVVTAVGTVTTSAATAWEVAMETVVWETQTIQHSDRLTSTQHDGGRSAIFGDICISVWDCSSDGTWTLQCHYKFMGIE